MDNVQSLPQLEVENSSSSPGGMTGSKEQSDPSSFAPVEDFTSFCRGELADALTEALFALYKGGPTKPSEALKYGNMLVH